MTPEGAVTRTADGLSTATSRRRPRRAAACDRATVIPLHRVAAPLVALLAVGALAGCSQEAADAPVVGSAPAGAVTATPTTPAASLAGATPTPVTTRSLPLPEQTELSRTFTVDGASAFAAYFTQVLNYANGTGDPALLLSISDAGCSGCRYQADVIDEYRARGYSSTGFEIQFTGTRVDSWDAAKGEIGLTVSTTKTAFETTDLHGRVVGSAPSVPNGEFWLDLNWSDGRWIVWEVE